MIRLFCVVEPPKVRSWGRLSLDYLTALAAGPEPIRAISLSGGADLNHPDWLPVKHHFQTPFDTLSTYIVAGPPAFLDRLWTVGMRNIAICGGGRTTWVGVDSAKEPLAKYDEVWVADESLYDCIYNTIYVPPWTASEYLQTALTKAGS